MSRRAQSLFLDLGLLGTAAFVASVTLSLLVEPLVAPDLFVSFEPRDTKTISDDSASLNGEVSDRLAALTALPLTPADPKIQISKTPGPSPLRFVVAGTVVGRVAVLLDPNTRSSLIVRIGDLLEDAVVTAIERGRVIIRRDGRDEVLAKGPTTPGPALAPTEAIRTLTAERLSVPRSIVDAARLQPQLIGTQAFFMPAVQDGRAALRIDRIKPGSLLQQLGLQNGDVLVSINDITFDRVDVLMKQYGELHNTREVRVSFLRGGQIQRRTYEIGG